VSHVKSLFLPSNLFDKDDNSFEREQTGVNKTGVESVLAMSAISVRDRDENLRLFDVEASDITPIVFKRMLLKIK